MLAYNYDFLKKRLSINNIHLVPIHLVNSEEGGVIRSCIALIDLEDPYMLHTEMILNMIPRELKRGIMLIWTFDGVR